MCVYLRARCCCFAGKTSTCARIAELTGFTHIEVGALIRDLKLFESWNEEFDVSEFDEDKVCDELETRLQKGAHTQTQGSEQQQQQQQRAANSDGTVAAPQPQVHAATRSAG